MLEVCVRAFRTSAVLPKSGGVFDLFFFSGGGELHLLGVRAPVLHQVPERHPGLGGHVGRL